MKITRHQLRSIIKETLKEAIGDRPWEGERPAWADAHYTELGRRKKMVARWKAQGVTDTVDFEAWMAELVKATQAGTAHNESESMLSFQAADPHDEETWERLITDLAGYGQSETNYYDEWFQAQGSLTIAKDLGATIAQHMNSDAAEM